MRYNCNCNKIIMELFTLLVGLELMDGDLLGMEDGCPDIEGDSLGIKLGEEDTLGFSLS